MSGKKFQPLQRFLHFQNDQDPQYNPDDPDKDRLFKIRTLKDMVRQKINSVYYPPKNLTQGKINFQAVHQNERSRYGIKMFEWTTTGSIQLDFMIYPGNIEPTLTKPWGQNWLQTEQIPISMIEAIL